MGMRNCPLNLPIVDQSRVGMLSVETTGPLPNVNPCQRCGRRRCKCKRRR